MKKRALLGASGFVISDHGAPLAVCNVRATAVGGQAMMYGAAATREDTEDFWNPFQLVFCVNYLLRKTTDTRRFMGESSGVVGALGLSNTAVVFIDSVERNPEG